MTWLGLFTAIVVVVNAESVLVTAKVLLFGERHIPVGATVIEDLFSNNPFGHGFASDTA